MPKSPSCGDGIGRIAGDRPGARPHTSGSKVRYSARAAATNAGKGKGMTRDLKDLEGTKMRLYKLLREELAGGDKWLDYDKLAERLSISRPAVTYNVQKLKEMGYIGARGGKLYLRSG